MDREIRAYSPYSFYDHWNEAYEERRDIEYMRRMYPSAMRKLQDIVEDECDRMEYEGSMMFDEYPDRVRIDTIIKRIYDRSRKTDEPVVETEECRGDDCLIRDVIAVMLFNEMYKRRSRRRRRKYFY